MITNPAVAQEIVRSVAGTLGLIAAVPFTTALAALAAVHSEPGVRDASSGPGSRLSPDVTGVRTERA
ncbi:hypothetical protein [Actinomadura sp. 3N407]|uniref:hypothetical protein n=1 Tax=Actinomadura sp. 3N407 TaxID=3457423 RepID=UPI003FCEE32F